MTIVDTAALRFIDPAELVPASDNPRRDLGDLTELADSIASVGVLEPIVATPRDGTLLIVMGHRRHAAAVKAGLELVPVIVRELDEIDRHRQMLSENMHRANLAPIEEAHALARIAELGVTQRDLAAKVGISQSTISKRLSLLKLPEQGQALLDAGGITVEDAQKLASKVPAGALAKLFGGRKAPDRYDIAQAIHQVEQHDRVVAEHRKARDSGVAIVERPKNGWSESRAPVPLSMLYGRVPKNHDTLECHAVVLEPHGITRVCTKPANHPKPKGAQQRSEKEKAEEAARKPLLERQEIRRQFVDGTALSAPPDAWPAYLVAMLDGGYTEVDISLETLVRVGLADKPAKGSLRWDQERAMVANALAGVSSTQAARLLYGLALELGESVVSGDRYGAPRIHEDQKAAAGHHLTHLRERGYEPAEVELVYCGLIEPNPHQLTVKLRVRTKAKWDASCSCGWTSDVPATTETFAKEKGELHLAETAAT